MLVIIDPTGLKGPLADQGLEPAMFRLRLGIHHGVVSSSV
jgi:hypothetical protein